jgi:hypothetical protein
MIKNQAHLFVRNLQDKNQFQSHSTTTTAKIYVFLTRTELHNLDTNGLYMCLYILKGYYGRDPSA